MAKLTNLTNEQKQEIIRLIHSEIKRLGSQSAVGNKCKVSEATISLMLKDEYNTKGVDAWLKVGTALGWRPAGWQEVETRNVKQMKQCCSDAQFHSMFLAVSCNAGAGKTTGIQMYLDEDKTGNVFYIKCREWSKRDFLENLCQTLGIPADKGYTSPDKLVSKIIKFFSLRAGALLIVDQANSLKPAARSIFIHLHNEFEGKIGILLAGTDELEREIKRGVKYAKKGYDEVDSRFGRNYVRLIGSTYKDMVEICTANGVTGDKTLEDIWKECNPVSRKYKGAKQEISVIEDHRILKRAIQRHLLTH